MPGAPPLDSPLHPDNDRNNNAHLSIAKSFKFISSNVMLLHMLAPDDVTDKEII